MKIVETSIADVLQGSKKGSVNDFTISNAFSQELMTRKFVKLLQLQANLKKMFVFPPQPGDFFFKFLPLFQQLLFNVKYDLNIICFHFIILYFNRVHVRSSHKRFANFKNQLIKIR